MTRNGRTNRRLPDWGKIALLFTLVTLVISLAMAPTAQAVPDGPETALQTLLDKAEVNGNVRVIIELNVPFTPEGELASTQAVERQQRVIQTAQNHVWQQVAGGSNQLIANYRYIPYMAAVVDKAALSQLAASPEVVSIQEDQLAAPSLANSVPVIGGDTAWSMGYTGAGQTVAILDTGVDKTHTFLDGGKVVSEACYSSNGYIAGYGNYVTVCPDGKTSSTAAGSGVDCVGTVTGLDTSPETQQAQSDCKHGTHVAGIAAGDGGGTSYIGVAKEANIIAVQVFSFFTDYDRALTFSSDQISGLERVYELRNDYDIAAVNMSLGGGQYYSACDGDARKAIIDSLRAAGIATIVASGNEGYRDSMGAPACISSAISVGATDNSDIIPYFSNIASFIDLLAPGYSIVSSIPDPNNINHDSTGPKSGTSMATPHVAGAWAVVKSLAPNATVDEVLANFKNTGTLVDDNRIPGGTIQDIPRINLDLALGAFNIPPVASNDGAPTPLNTAVTVNVLLNDTDPDNGSLTIIYVSTPAHGTAVQINNTTIQYIPDNNYSGADSFTYTIADNVGSEATATVHIIVDGKSTYLPAVLRN